MDKVYCPACKTETEYVLKSNIIKEFKGINVNLEERIPVCEACNEELFVEEIEEDNLKRLYDKYRQLTGTVTPQDIKNFRAKYNLSQRELVAILNWGKMTINRYESGAVPNASHNDLLKQIINNALFLKEKVEEAYQKQRITKKTYNKMQRAFDKHEDDLLKEIIINLLRHEESINNGFKKFDYEKFENLVSYLASRVTLYKTSLNKYIWYIDFLNFKKYSRSITGLTYQRYTHGPIIEDFKYEHIINIANEKFYKEENEYCTRTETIIKSKNNYDLSVFSNEELEVINHVIKEFKNMNCSDISNKSHEERAWKEKKNKEIIPYNYAEFLSLDL